MKNQLFLSLVIFFVITPFLFGQTNAPASPRDQLLQLTTQLQQSPGDQALREKIIALALTMNPKPTLPEDAERHVARGIAAFKAAQSTEDYKDATKEFAQATLAAPWYSDAYYNLGVAQDKAEQYDEALRSLKLAQLASPGSKDIKDLTYQVEYRADQANSPEGKAAKRYGPAQHRFAGLIEKLDGAVFVKEDQDASDSWHEGNPTLHSIRFYRSGRYNLLMCHTQIKEYEIEPEGKRKYEWEDQSYNPAGYVMPQRAGERGGGFDFPDNGQDLFEGCGLGARLSADGRTIEEIGRMVQTMNEVRGVWRRQ